MAIYRNIIVPVPATNRVINHKKGLVFHVREKVYQSDLQYNKDKRCLIGYLNGTDETTMNPNANYAWYYPEEFRNASKNKLAPVIKRVGIYTIMLAICQQWGVYQALVEATGPENANNLMDYAMYCLLSKSNVMKDYEVLMKDQLLFGDQLYSDSSMGSFFQRDVTASHIEEFRSRWAGACKKRGVKHVWLCIDGSNNDCRGKKIDYAEEGHNKSHKKCNCYSYMYAVDARDGMPITYRLYRGGRIDSKELNEIVGVLHGYGVEVEGIVLDRGFCTIECFRLILDAHYKYIIKLKENTGGYRLMYEKYGELLKHDSSTWVAPHTYAITGKGRVFKKYDEESYITLMYDSENGRERADYLNEEIEKEAKRLNEEAVAGGNPVPNSKYRRFFIKVPVGNTILFDIDYASLDQEKASKGYSAIACSHNLTSKEIAVLYGKRDASEKQYMIMKSQLGFHTGRAHTTEGIEARHLACFVAQIVKTKLSGICHSLKYEPTTAFKELSFLCIQRNPDNEYEYFYNASDKQLALMNAVGLDQKDMKTVAEEESRRANGKVFNQTKKLPLREIFRMDEQESPLPITSEPAKKKEADASLEKPKKEADADKPMKEAPMTLMPKKRGRKPGTKNRPKEIIEAEKAAKAAVPKRGPGRPKGSKNKPKT